ncbi:hypothetical protein AAG570_003225 [Ranatra chinensis]|uniref:Uncharacterized protein n=1 Tax=Ranatra chinensis TaxID=642074 RepID=A0ABD0Y662_9HEMI
MVVDPGYRLDIEPCLANLHELPQGLSSFAIRSSVRTVVTICWGEATHWGHSLMVNKGGLLHEEITRPTSLNCGFDGGKGEDMEDAWGLGRVSSLASRNLNFSLMTRVLNSYLFGDRFVSAFPQRFVGKDELAVAGTQLVEGRISFCPHVGRFSEDGRVKFNNKRSNVLSRVREGIGRLAGALGQVIIDVSPSRVGGPAGGTAHSANRRAPYKWARRPHPHDSTPPLIDTKLPPSMT